MPTEAVVGIFTLLGVLLGGTLTALFEIWRRALDARSAARVVRMETIENRASALATLEEARLEYRLEDSAWLTHRLAVAQILDGQTFSALHHAYGFIGVAQHEMRELGRARRGEETLRHWADDLTMLISLLAQVERMRIWRLMWSVLGNPPPVVFDMASFGSPSYHDEDEEETVKRSEG